MNLLLKFYQNLFQLLLMKRWNWSICFRWQHPHVHRIQKIPMVKNGIVVYLIHWLKQVSKQWWWFKFDQRRQSHFLASGLALGIVFSAVLFRRMFIDQSISRSEVNRFPLISIRSSMACLSWYWYWPRHGLQQLSKWFSCSFCSSSSFVHS